MRRTTSVLVIALITASLGFTLPRIAQDYPGAVTADPEHYSVEFENDVIRVLRIEYGPGETSSMHSHPAGCHMFITDATSTFELPNGETVDASGTAGQVLCGDAQVHLPTNTGNTPVQVIAVELKGRNVFSQ